MFKRLSKTPREKKYRGNQGEDTCGARGQDAPVLSNSVYEGVEGGSGRREENSVSGCAPHADTGVCTHTTHHTHHVMHMYTYTFYTQAPHTTYATHATHATHTPHTRHTHVTHVTHTQTDPHGARLCTGSCESA